MSVSRWQRDLRVIARAYFLSEINELIGDLQGRQESPRIMQKAIEMALEGNLKWVEFCLSRAYPRVRVEQPPGATVSMRDLCDTSENDTPEESQAGNRKAEGGAQ